MNNEINKYKEKIGNRMKKVLFGEKYYLVKSIIWRKVLFGEKYYLVKSIIW